MIEMKYGQFNEEQLDNYKKKLHSKIHWLLIYKDPATAKEYEDVDFYQYFDYVMKEINGLNELLLYPDEIVELMSILEAAWLESLQLNYSFAKYRKLILDAHHLIDIIAPIKYKEG